MILQDRMYQGDALCLMKELPANSIDLIVTDPPYESMEKHRSHGTTTRLKNSKGSSNDWFTVVTNDYLGKILVESFRVLKPNTHIYVMCDPETQFALHPLFEEAGFKVETPIIWEKLTKHPYPVNCLHCGKMIRCQVCSQKLEQRHIAMGMGYPYRHAYEVIMFAQKGKKPPPEDKTIRNIFSFPRMKGGKGWSGRDLFPAEKPVELSERIICQASEENELVLDPFAGSGSILAAAKKNKRMFLGFEISQEAVDNFNEDIKTVVD